MSDGLVELIARLEATPLDPEDDPERLVAAAGERQRTLTRIGGLDAPSLDPETRRALVERVRALHERDLRLLSALRRRHAEALAALDRVLQARGAARGYGSQAPPPRKGVHRIG